uniref:Uncharacterized protein n=1 Tax=Falco tinnunculus TaxID=100819 RepID=A0A8C4VEM4_FALTI
MFSFPHCTTRLGSLRAHPPIVFLRYTLHVFSHTVDLLAHHTFLVLFTSFFFALLCTDGHHIMITNYLCRYRWFYDL